MVSERKRGPRHSSYLTEPFTKRREEFGITRQELAEKTGWKYATVATIESRSHIGKKAAEKYAKALLDIVKQRAEHYNRVLSEMVG